MGTLRALSASGIGVRSWTVAGTENRMLALIALGGVAASVFVAYAAAVNPDAAPGGTVAWLARAAYVLAPAAVGVYAWHRHPEEHLGRLPVWLTAATALWTLNGSSDPALFGVAKLVGVFVAPLLSYVVLSFPDGRLHSRLERWVVAGRRGSRGVLGPAGVHHRTPGRRQAAGSLCAPLS